jgi:four helix bundle protein
MASLRNLLRNALTFEIPPKFGGTSGVCDAVAFAMVIRHFSQLVCWQLARDLQREIFEITSKPPFRGNRDLHDQVRDAASSARRNIAEGFGRRTHKDQANFFATALTSLNEVEDELGEAVDNGYVTSEEIGKALTLKKRAVVATSRFRNSIKDRPDPEWNRWPDHRPSRTARPK